MEEVAQAVERFRVMDESDDGTSSLAGKDDQTPTEEKKAAWDDVRITHLVIPITPRAMSLVLSTPESRLRAPPGHRLKGHPHTMHPN